MFKNTASQKWVVFAFEDEGGTNPGEPVTSGAAAITANLYLDGSATPNAVDDLNPTELGGGYYVFDITAAESNADNIVIAPVSATANVNVIGVPGVVFPTQLTNDAAIADAVWDEILSGHTTAGSAGKRLSNIPGVVVREGTAQGPGTGTNQIQLDTGASAVDNTYDPSVITLTGGTGLGQSRLILQYLGSTKTATVDRDWKVAPDATSDFVIIADAGRAHVNEGLAQAGGTATITLNALASATDDVYVGQIVHIRSGTGADQAGTIIAYNGTTKVATVHKDWGTVPDSTSGYVMLPSSPVELTDNSVDLIWDEPLTNPTHNVANSAGRRLRFLQESGSVYGGFIWIDTINGTAGTSDYENGTSDNPVNSIADANTLAASLGIDRFMVSPGSSLTFAATQSNEEFHGKNWTLALGGQSIAGTFINGATITGIGTGSNYHLHDCHLGTGTLADGDISFSSIDGTLTLSAAGSYRLNGCYSGIAGAATPTIDFGAAVGNTALNMRHYSGGVTIANKDAVGTDTMSLEGNGKLVVAASSSGAISIRGNFQVTNTGGATITYDDNTLGIANIETDTTSIETKVDTVDANVDLILADTGTDGVVLSSATQTAIADALLNRDMSAVSDTTARSPLNALRLLRNKYSVAGSTLTVTKEDDITSAWTSTLTTDATADPVTGSDPA